MTTARDQLDAYEAGSLTFPALLDWARTFTWAKVWSNPRAWDLDRDVPWPTPDSPEEITAAEIDGILTEEEAESLFAAVEEGLR
jgi:hypothetical protein